MRECVREVMNKYRKTRKGRVRVGEQAKWRREKKRKSERVKNREKERAGEYSKKYE